MKHNIHHTSGHFASTLEMIAKKKVKYGAPAGAQAS